MASKCVLFSFMRVLRPQNWRCSIWFERLRGLRKLCPVHEITRAYSGKTRANISLFINGPWMHKTLPLSWHLLTWKKFIQACFSKKHDINISSEADSRITFHVCLYIIQYSLQFNPSSKFYFLSNLTKNTLLEKRELEMQRNLWSKSVLTKGEMQWRDRRKSFIT